MRNYGVEANKLAVSILRSLDAMEIEPAVALMACIAITGHLMDSPEVSQSSIAAVPEFDHLRSAMLSYKQSTEAAHSTEQTTSKEQIN